MQRSITTDLGNGTAVTATWDATPCPGTVVADLGHGVTVVEREAPHRAGRNGAAWAAPYSVNCAGHGWIVSRATVNQASSEAHAHIAAEH